ncbi:hypothetical protein GCM10022232_89990 [Streptomyces plumbiresistens]|uniref:Uncharacterized protein n=1 Tax=Streptomyces plumbiresistens TaxID=511811 RepID=A0ABP7TRU7_9ACTN
MGVQDLPEEQPQPSAEREKAVSFRARRLWGEVGACGGGLELARSGKSVLKVSLLGSRGRRPRRRPDARLSGARRHPRNAPALRLSQVSGSTRQISEKARRCS